MIYELNKLYRVVPSHNAGAMVFSKLSGLDFGSRKSTATGVKFVLDGREDYMVGNNHQPVTSGHFLIVNAQQDYAASIPKNQVAVGLCIDIDCDIINDVLNVSYKRKETLLEEGDSLTKGVYNFFEEVRPIRGSGFANRLIALTSQLNNNQTVVPGEEIYYQLAFELLREDNPGKIAIAGIETKKQSTKEELYRRLKLAKAMLDDSLFTEISLNGLAAAASLSKFHLLRLFKIAYHLSPHQYQLKRRMEYAAMLLKTGNRSLQDISILMNYADQQSFNKLFKKHFGISPGKFRKG